MTLSTNQKIGLFTLAYLLFNVFSQLALSQTVDIDQSEQMLLSQQFQWGYNAQPPLYTYLVMVLFKLFGVNLVVILLLKACLLWLLVVVMLKIGEVLAFKPYQQIINILGLALIPHLVFHSQRDLTHSILLTLVAAVTLWQVFLLIKNKGQELWRYALVGVLAAVGLYSKYNYLVFLTALLLTLLALPRYRFVVLTPKIMMSIAVATLLFLPHFLWVLEHMQTAVSGLDKSEAQLGLFKGIQNAVVKFITTFIPLTLFAAPLFLQYKKLKNQAGTQVIAQKNKPLISHNHHENVQFFYVLTIMTLGFILVFILFGEARVFKQRWFQPLFFYFPLLAAMYAGDITEQQQPFKHKAVKRYRNAGVFFAVLVMLLLPARILFAGHLKKIDRPSMPYPSLLKKIKQTQPTPAFIVVNKGIVGGNAKNIFKQTHILRKNSHLNLSVLLDSIVQKSAKASVNSRLGLAICHQKQCPELTAWLAQHDLVKDMHSEKKYAHPYYYADNKGSMTLYIYRVAISAQQPSDSSIF